MPAKELVVEGGYRGVCVGGLIAEPSPCLYMKPPSSIYLLAGWLAGSVSVGEIVDDVEINVCFLLTRKSWSWVE